MATIDPVAKSKLDAAVQYACKLRSGFEPIFEDGRLELTNNRAERNIKELVIGRKIGCIPQVLKEHELQESF